MSALAEGCEDFGGLPLAFALGAAVVLALRGLPGFLFGWGGSSSITGGSSDGSISSATGGCCSGGVLSEGSGIVASSSAAAGSPGVSGAVSSIGTTCTASAMMEGGAGFMFGIIFELFFELIKYFMLKFFSNREIIRYDGFRNLRFLGYGLSPNTMLKQICEP